MKTTMQFTVEKETKGAVRYQETKADATAEGVVGTLYIRKTALKGEAIPAELTVTIESK